jgi:lipid II:glycine glycyltransferase (peptidoglycan interpeptide bridge formation enzyme)
LDPNTSSTNTQDTLFESGWQKLGHTIQPQNTNIISLHEGEDTVFARMSGNYRKKIRRAVKHGCEVEILTHANAESIDRFYRIMDEIYHRTKFIMSGKDYFEKIWNTFGPLDSARILIVKHDGIDIGSIMYLYNGDVAYELYGGTGDAGRSIMANYLLKWEGIKLAIKLGKQSYDQWGVAPKVDGEYDTKHPLANISKFKSGFGGEDVEFLSQFVKVFNPLAYLFYRMGLLVNGLKLKLRKL